MCRVITADQTGPLDGEVNRALLQQELRKLLRLGKVDSGSRGPKPLWPRPRTRQQPGWHVLLGQLRPVEGLFEAIDADLPEQGTADFRSGEGGELQQGLGEREVLSG